MDPSILKSLGLPPNLSENDLKMLNKIFKSSGNGKALKITPDEKNRLLSKLSSSTTITNTPIKQLKDMTEEEKIEYKKELKNRMKNKKNEMKMTRSSNVVRKQNLDKSNDKMGGFKDMIQDAQEAINENQNNITNNVKEEDIEDDDNLDDFIVD